MKQITADRIIATLDKINDAVSSKTKRGRDIIRPCTLLGFKSLAGIATQRDFQALDLELTYAEAPKHPEMLEGILDEVMRQAERYNLRREWVYAIQQRYKVSGLIDGETTLGDRTVKHKTDHEQLRLIPEDLPILQQYKLELIDLWATYSVAKCLDFYVWVGGGWKPTELSQVYLETSLYDWAEVHEDAWYTSPPVMKSKGYDQFRRNPKYPDDELRTEVHLRLGAGIDVDSPKRSLWVCASNKFPCL